MPPGCRFHPRCPRRQRLAEAGVDTSACTERDPAVLPAAGEQRVACHFAADETSPAAEPLPAGL